jgi:hypothetical protein
VIIVCGDVDKWATCGTQLGQWTGSLSKGLKLLPEHTTIWEHDGPPSFRCTARIACPPRLTNRVVSASYDSVVIQTHEWASDGITIQLLVLGLSSGSGSTHCVCDGLNQAVGLVSQPYQWVNTTHAPLEHSCQTRASKILQYVCNRPVNIRLYLGTLRCKLET